MSKVKIVLVEDDEVIAKVLHAGLLEAGFEVAVAETGETGLAAVRENKPDLVLLDLMLPEKHGFEVLAELKKSAETRAIPVIILTVMSADEDRKTAMLIGASDYIVKSQYTSVEIIKKIKSFFAAEKRSKK